MVSSSVLNAHSKPCRPLRLMLSKGFCLLGFVTQIPTSPCSCCSQDMRLHISSFPTGISLLPSGGETLLKGCTVMAKERQGCCSKGSSEPFPHCSMHICPAQCRNCSSRAAQTPHTSTSTAHLSHGTSTLPGCCAFSQDTVFPTHNLHQD